MKKLNVLTIGLLLNVTFLQNAVCANIVDARVFTLMFAAIEGQTPFFDAVAAVEERRSSRGLNTINERELNQLQSEGLGSSLEYLQAIVDEAQADVEYYESRVESAQIFVRKTKLRVPFFYTRLKRSIKLNQKGALSAYELEQDRLNYDQGLEDVKLFESNLRKEQADLRSARARLQQAIAARKLSPAP